MLTGQSITGTAGVRGERAGPGRITERDNLDTGDKA